jgi:hypothetical protein
MDVLKGLPAVLVGTVSARPISGPFAVHDREIRISVATQAIGRSAPTGDGRRRPAAHSACSCLLLGSTHGCPRSSGRYVVFAKAKGVVAARSNTMWIAR